MTRLFRLLVLCLGLATATLAVAGPGVARDVHEIAHLSSPVADNEHHHHAADGSVIADQGEPDDTDKADGGHDHMLTGAAQVAAIDTGSLLAPPTLAELAHGLPSAAAPPPNRASAPPFQPPRFA